MTGNDVTDKRTISRTSKVGMEASFAKTVSEADIVAFADVTGDKNPVHLDAEYAAETIFKERIAHGMLSAGYISAVFGMECPGPGAIYVSQTLNFRAPVKIGDAVVAKVRSWNSIRPSAAAAPGSRRSASSTASRSWRARPC